MNGESGTWFTLLGIGAMNSPRYAPAGLLVERGRTRIAIDGGPGAEPVGPVAAWLAAGRGLIPEVRAYQGDGLTITPYPVVHTSHPAYGYLIEADGRRAAWAPEFLEFPDRAADTDLMFAEAASWARPIRFAKGAGGTRPFWRWPTTRSVAGCDGWSSLISGGLPSPR